AEGGDVDEALAVYGRGMAIAETLAAGDPDNVLQQSDVASGHYEIGTMLVNGRRYLDAEPRFVEAFDRFAKLAVADSGNVSNRVWMARSGRQAGEVCRALAR